MPRPKNKEELLQLSEENFNKLFDLIYSLNIAEQRAEYLFDNGRDKNIRDILVHLHHWHLMMLEWYKVGMRGEEPDKPAKGYTFKDTPALNAKIWQMYQKTSFDEAVRLLKESYAKVREIIQNHSNEELFEKRHYKWTGTTSMGSYLISNTSSHYDWALKLLKKYKKSLKDKKFKK